MDKEENPRTYEVVEVTFTSMGGSTLAVLNDVTGALSISDLTKRATMMAIQNGFELEKMQLTLDGRRLQNEELLGDVSQGNACVFQAILSAPGYAASLELSSDNARTRMIAADAIGKIGPPAAQYAEKLAAMLQDPSGVAARFKAAEALGNIGPKAVPFAAEYLQDSEASVRKLVIGIIGKVGSPSAEPYIPQLVALLRDTKVDVRNAAAEALGRVGVACAPETAALLSDPEPKARSCAAEVLANFGEASAPYCEQLCALFRDSNSPVRCSAVKAVAAIGVLAMPYAAALLKDDDLTARRCAAEALGGIGPAAKEHVPDIEALLEVPRVEVQACARKALEQILS